jgi:multicomponent K+:H+ antiporter subunit A
MIRKIDLDPRLGRLQGRILFDLFLKHLLLTSRKIKQKTENGSLQSYLFLIIAFSIIMVTLPLFNQGLTTGTRELTHAPWIAVVLWLTLFSGCWMMLGSTMNVLKLYSLAVQLVLWLPWYLSPCRHLT